MVRIDVAQIHALIFDLDSVIPEAASLQARAWQQLFDEFLGERARSKGTQFVPFEGSPIPEARWEHFAHDADIGVRGCGPTMAAAFEQAALALAAVVTDPAHVALRQCASVACEAPSAELLLVDWLNEIVLRMATEGLVFGAFEVAISGTRLDGLARGEPVDIARHQPAVEVKGATLTALEVAERPDGSWSAQCVVDV